MDKEHTNLSLSLLVLPCDPVNTINLFPDSYNNFQTDLYSSNFTLLKNKIQLSKF